MTELRGLYLPAREVPRNKAKSFSGDRQEKEISGNDI
jgi:hypothetical protein